MEQGIRLRSMAQSLGLLLTEVFSRGKEISRFKISLFRIWRLSEEMEEQVRIQGAEAAEDWELEAASLSIAQMLSF